MALENVLVIWDDRCCIGSLWNLERGELGNGFDVNELIETGVFGVTGGDRSTLKRGPHIQQGETSVAWSTSPIGENEGGANGPALRGASFGWAR